MRRLWDQRLFHHFDWALFFCTALLVVIALLNLFSATHNGEEVKYFFRQVKWMGGGAFVAFVVLFFDYRWFSRIAFVTYGIVVLMLVAVSFKGRSALGAQRWLDLGFLSVQPSELAKLTMALVLAKYFDERKVTSALDLRGLILPGILTLVPVVLILKQPDLGTAIIVAAVSVCMILFVGVQRKILITGFIAALVAMPLAWNYGLHDYQKKRVHTFLDPEKDPMKSGYQIIQSKIAVGSGELLGKGYLQGSQGKLEFLPKHYTDFVFSNFAEEFGFVGSGLILFLFASFTLLGFNAAVTAKDRFGMHLAFGISSLVATQAIINLAMEIGALPVVGVPLPIFSYGGTSLLTTMLSIGILLNISMRRYLF